VVFNKVSDAVVRNSRAMEGTKTFLKVSGKESRGIILTGNDLRKASTACHAEKDVPNNAIRAVNNVP